MSVWSRLAAMIAPDDGFLYHDAHYLSAEMEIDAEAARRWIPAPLRIASPAIATVFTAFFPETTFGSVYREAGLFLHVEHRGVRALHCPWMLVDDDVALVMGRELLGYPKKMGAIRFDRDGDRIEGHAERRGATLIEMRGTLGEPVAQPPPFLGRPHRNVRSSLGLAIPWVVAFTPREVPVEVRRAEIEVTVSGSERDPLHELGFGRVRAAYLHRVNLGRGDLPKPVAIASPLAMARNLLLRVR